MRTTSTTPTPTSQVIVKHLTRHPGPPVIEMTTNALGSRITNSQKRKLTILCLLTLAVRLRDMAVARTST